jgi:murein DD-endopeptidase MepM/ murein hydrolase activator NlpD
MYPIFYLMLLLAPSLASAITVSPPLLLAENQLAATPTIATATPKPVSVSTPTLPAPTKKAFPYVIKVGDSLNSIANKHGASFQQVVVWNHLTPPYHIHAGQRLLLFPTQASTNQAIAKPLPLLKSPEKSPASLPIPVGQVPLNTEMPVKVATPEAPAAIKITPLPEFKPSALQPLSTIGTSTPAPTPTATPVKPVLKPIGQAPVKSEAAVKVATRDKPIALKAIPVTVGKPKTPTALAAATTPTATKKLPPVPKPTIPPRLAKASTTDKENLQSVILVDRFGHEIKSPTVADSKTKAIITSPPEKMSDIRKKIPVISAENKKMLQLNFGWPMKGIIAKDFSSSENKGIDITVKESTQTVSAAEAGKVVYQGQGLVGLRNLIIIKHDNDYLTAYANNNRSSVKEGQQVSKGQAIAEIGMTGKQQKPLHFEIRKNGNPINPLELLPKN